MATKQKKGATSNIPKVTKPKLQLAPQKPVISMKKSAQNRKLKSTKVKEKGKPVISKAGYSLYSSESEDQLTAVRRDMDRCTRLVAHLVREKYGTDSHKKEMENPQQKVLSDVSAPFNSRISSSTPDPEKLLESEKVFQVIPERDCSTSTITADDIPPLNSEKQTNKLDQLTPSADYHGISRATGSQQQFGYGAVREDFKNKPLIQPGVRGPKCVQDVADTQLSDKIKTNQHKYFNGTSFQLPVQVHTTHPPQTLSQNTQSYDHIIPSLEQHFSNGGVYKENYQQQSRLSDIAGMEHFLHRESEEFVPFQGYKTGSFEALNQQTLNEQRQSSSVGEHLPQPTVNKLQLSSYMYDQLASVDSSVREHIIQALREKDANSLTNKSQSISIPSKFTHNSTLPRDKQFHNNSTALVDASAHENAHENHGVDRYEVPERDTSGQGHTNHLSSYSTNMQAVPCESFKDNQPCNKMQDSNFPDAQVSKAAHEIQSKIMADGEILSKPGVVDIKHADTQLQNNSTPAVIYHCCKCMHAVPSQKHTNSCDEKSKSFNISSTSNHSQCANPKALQNASSLKSTSDGEPVSFAHSEKSTNSQETQTNVSSVDHSVDKQDMTDHDVTVTDVNLLPKQFQSLLGGSIQLKALLKQLKDIAKVSKDANVKKLCREIDKTLKTVPQMKENFNLDAEIGLLLQPLRSENSDLRRRLRIVNQQLKDFEREKIEKEKEKTEKGGFNFEMVHLQTTNAYLQKQIKEEQDNKVKILKQINELKGEISQMKLEKQHLTVQLSQEDTEKMKLKEQCQGEMLRLQRQLEILHREVCGVQSQWKSSQQENNILHITLKERDSEINKLQQQIVNLKCKISDVLHELQQNIHSTDKPVLMNASFSLKKILKDLNGNQLQRSQSPTRSVMSDPGTESIDPRQKPMTRVQVDRYDIDSLVSPRSLTADAIAHHDKHSKKASKKSRKELDFEEQETSSEMSFNDLKMPPNRVNTKTKNMHNTRKHSEPQIIDSSDQIGFKKTDHRNNLMQYHTIGSEQVPGNSDYLNQTRFSVTDYFNKYRPKDLSAHDMYHTSPYTQSSGGSDNVPNTETSLSSSKQDDHFRGTELDLSLSTIDDKMSSITSLITRTSVSTAVTVDDRAFRRGIEILDSNIAKVQDSLKKTREMFT